MKKRSLLGLLVACMMLVFTGCEGLPFLQAPTIEGEWEAKWDLTDTLIDAMGEEMGEYADCFKDIVLKVNIEFTEDEVKIEADEDSVEDFKDSIIECVFSAIDVLLEDTAKDMGMSVADLYSMMGFTEETYREAVLKEMNMDKMVAELIEDMDASGEYEYDEDDEDVIIVTYEDEDEDEEKWELELDGDELTITIETDEMEIELECERK